MKRIICLILVAITLLTTMGIACYGYFGTGVEAVASEVKLVKTGLKGQKLSFSDSDVKSALCISGFKSITVTRLPQSTEGTLLLAGRRVKENQLIKRKNIGALVFVPASADVTEGSFGFKVEGVGSQEEIECRVRFVDKINYAPKAPEENEAALVKTTQQTIGIFGRMDATDPEGDALEFITVSYPKNGTLTVKDKTTGVYKYTPVEGYTGYDRFVYVARDEYGNYSEAVTVNIKVIERMSDEVFRDMTDREEYNAAVAMSALGIMSSTRVGDDLYFSPDGGVTRAEFCAMAMKAYGVRPDSSLGHSYFDDDGEIPDSLRGYVATAQRLGIVDGSFKDGQLTFKPNEGISHYEAATVMARLIGIRDSAEEEAFMELNSIPVWARGSVGAMVTLGIFDDSHNETVLNSNLTRAAAAECLYRALKVRG